MRRLVPILLVCLACGCEAEVVDGLDSAQADEVILALDGAGIGAQRARSEGASDGSTYRITVARAELPSALAVLRDLDLPRESTLGYAELFEGSGLIPSATEERARLAAATSGELVRSIESMEGVRRARVHIALSDPSAHRLDEDASRPRASVLAQHPPDARVDEQAIRALVTGAVPGLDPADVTVVLDVRQRASAPSAQLSYVGPIAVSRGSATLLKTILAGSLALHLLFAVILVLSRRQASRKTQRRTSRKPASEQNLKPNPRPTESQA